MSKGDHELNYSQIFLEAVQSLGKKPVSKSELDKYTKEKYDINISDHITKVHRILRSNKMFASPMIDALEKPRKVKKQRSVEPMVKKKRVIRVPTKTVKELKGGPKKVAATKTVKELKGRPKKVAATKTVKELKGRPKKIAATKTLQPKSITTRKTKAAKEKKTTERKIGKSKKVSVKKPTRKEIEAAKARQKSKARQKGSNVAY